jgi:hypothetical protein
MKNKLMNRILFFSFCCIICVGLYSCEKNKDFIVPDPNQFNGPDTIWYNTIDESMNAVALKHDIQEGFDIDTVSLNSGTGLSFMTASELHFSINPGSIINGSGNVFLGNMIVKSMYVNSIGKSAQMMKQSLTNNGHLLSSGGTFFVAFYNLNNEELFIAPNNNISVSYHSDNSIANMKLFVENQIDLLYSNWQRPADSTQNNINVSSDNHTAHINQTGWVNCSSEEFYNNQQSKISLRLPSNYTNANTVAFLSFEDITAVINFNADVQGRIFKTGFLPAGRQATVIVISKQGGYYYMKQKSITTSSTATSGGYQVINLTPVISSIAELKNSLRGL